MYNLNPIPNGQIPQTYEASTLRSTRDRDTSAKQWRGNNRARASARSLTNTVNGLQKQLLRLRPRALAPSQQSPFLVYNVPMEYCPVAGTYGGNDYDPVKDAWRTFRVRIGDIGYRPKWTDPTTQPNGYAITGFQNALTFDSQFEMILRVNAGSDGNDYSLVSGGAGTGPQAIIHTVNLDDENYTLSNIGSRGDIPPALTEVKFVPDDGGSVFGTQNTFTTWVLPDTNLNGAFGIECGCWAEIVPDVDDETPAWARIGFRAFPLDPPNHSPFPNTADSFPLAIINQPVQGDGNFVAQSLEVYQLQFGNLLGRYGFESLNNRGIWDADDTNGLNNQVFYPNDVITLLDTLTLETSGSPTLNVRDKINDGSASNITDRPYFRPMIFVGDVPAIQAARPSFDSLDDNWTPFAGWTGGN